MAEELELLSNNPYADGYIITYADGTETLERETDAEPIKNIGDEYHTVKPGDELTRIAGEKYKDSQLWHVIAKANPQLDDYWNLPIGMQLIIPDASKVINVNA